MARIGDEGEGAFDAAVVGASFAGLSAALYLARGRRRVALIDGGGATRNRFAAHAQGVLGQDGQAPAAIRAAGLRDVLAYPGVTHFQGRAVDVAGEADGFRVALEGGGAVAARRVILAHGMRDALPPIPGLAECWGRTAIQCPYCHGYELADRPTGILMTAPGLPHHLRLVREWSDDLTLLANGHAVEPGDRAALEAQGVRVVEAPVTALRHRDGALEAVELEGAGPVALGALYLVTRAEFAADLPARLGLALAEGPQGRFVQADELRRTSRPGVFAAGDLARPMYNATLAAADGMTAGTACHRDLLGL